jgi:hypothetical protein
MSVMSLWARVALFVLVTAGLLPIAVAQAQYYGGSPQPPLYPYTQSTQPYAIQVAPNTYVTQRPAEQQRNYPYVRGNGGVAVAAPKPGRFDRPHKPVDHALVDELRKRQSKSTQDSGEQANTEPADPKPAGRGVINTTKIVRDPPVVRETRRYVDDPPRVIVRRHVVDDDTGSAEPEQQPRRDDNKKRVIAADAEVTILGPDRMSIRLFRKGQGPKANALAD